MSVCSKTSYGWGDSQFLETCFIGFPFFCSSWLLTPLIQLIINSFSLPPKTQSGHLHSTNRKSYCLSTESQFQSPPLLILLWSCVLGCCAHNSLWLPVVLPASVPFVHFLFLIPSWIGMTHDSDSLLPWNCQVCQVRWSKDTVGCNGLKACCSVHSTHFILQS